MDNCWCGGYTCQERISTFYGVVGASFTYVIGLTSTNPQNFALHLLNSNEDEAIVTRIIHNTPQRLDIFQGGIYIPPKNARLLPDGNLEYRDSDRIEEFLPAISDPNGANFYDRTLKNSIRGSKAYKIITTQIIMLSLSHHLNNCGWLLR